MQRIRCFKGAPGQITVVAALLLLVVAALLCVTLEGARIAGSRWYFQNAAAAAGESALATYMSELWNSYHLLLYYGEASLEEETENYLNEYLASDRAGNSLLFSSLTETAVSEVKTATDGAGYYFVKNAVSYMAYAEVSSVVSTILSQYDLLSQIKTAASFIQSLLSFGESIIELESLLSSLSSSASDMKKAATKLKTATASLTTLTQSLATALSEYNANSETVKKLLNEYTDALNAALTAEKAFQSKITSLESLLATYNTTSTNVNAALTLLIQEMEESQSSFATELWALLKSELTQLKSYASASGEKAELLSSLTELCTKAQPLAEFFDGLRSLELDNITAEEVAALRVSLASAGENLSSYTDYQIPTWLWSVAGSSSYSWKNALSTVISGLLSDGILGVFITNTSTISSKSMSMEDLPSVTMRTESAGEGESSWLLSIANQVLFQDYLLETFSGYTKSQGHRLSYEWEYLISGSTSDRENLTMVVSELFLIREGACFLENLQSAEKRAQAQAMAYAYVGFAGNAALVYVVELLLLGVWAADEAVSDVQALLKGEEVSFFSLAGQDGVTLSYKDYIRLLMLTVSLEELSYRAMDLIQYNIRSSSSSFLISDCIVSFRLTATAQSSWLFASLPLVSALTGSDSSGVSFSYSGSFSY